MFHFGEAIDTKDAGCLLYYYENNVTMIKVWYYYNGHRVMLGLIEQPGECSLYLVEED